MKIPPWLQVFGDISYRGIAPSEAVEQVTFFNWLRTTHKEWGAIALHPRNEGKRTHYQAMTHKAEGMTPGASDIIIPGKQTFVCELKRRDHTKSKWQDGQLEYLMMCKRAGAFVCVALGADAAKEAFAVWLEKN